LAHCCTPRRWSASAGCGWRSICGRSGGCRCCRSTTPRRRRPMAQAHTNGGYTNPYVRFARTDVDMPAVVRFAVLLGVVLTVASGLTLWLAVYLGKRETPRKGTDLPPAAVDDTKDVQGKIETFTPLPPEPRLEALDDVRARDKKSFEMLPPRAAEYYHK